MYCTIPPLRLSNANKRQSWKKVTEKKEKILFLSPQPFFRIRGTPINIRNVVTALGEAGHEVDLLCYPFGEPTDLPSGVQVLRSPGVWGIRDVPVGPSAAKIPLDFFMMLKTFWLLIRRRYTVIHAVEESIFFAAFLNRIFGKRLIYDMDSCISDQLKYSGTLKSKPLLRWIEWMEKTGHPSLPHRADGL